MAERAWAAPEVMDHRVFGTLPLAPSLSGLIRVMARSSCEARRR